MIITFTYLLSHRQISLVNQKLHSLEKYNGVEFEKFKLRSIGKIQRSGVRKIQTPLHWKNTTEWSSKNSNSTPLEKYNGVEFEKFKLHSIGKIQRSGVRKIQTPLHWKNTTEWSSKNSNSTPLEKYN